jgi:hypothetical protein
VWRLATLQPDRWAAIAPRNAWVSYRTFGGGLPAFSEPTPIEQMLLRTANTCDTSALVSNLAPCGVFVQHDPNDALVPVEQSRLLREQLAKFHPDFVYHEPRAGQSPTTGDCTFPPAVAQFFRDRHTVPLDRIELATFDPGTSSTNGWLTIAQQIVQLELSRASLRYDASRRSFSGTTSNVAALALAGARGCGRDARRRNAWTADVARFLASPTLVPPHAVRLDSHESAASLGKASAAVW